MGIKLDWGDYDNNFAVMTVVGKWSGDEFYNSMSRLVEMSHETENKIEFMVDIRNSVTPPNNLMTLIRTILNRPLPRNIKKVVVISSSSFWNRIYGMVETMYADKIGIPVIFVKTVDEAYQTLEFFEDMV